MSADVRRSEPGSAEYPDSQPPKERGVQCQQHRSQRSVVPSGCRCGHEIDADRKQPHPKKRGVSARYAEVGPTRAAATSIGLGCPRAIPNEATSMLSATAGQKSKTGHESSKSAICRTTAVQRRQLPESLVVWDVRRPTLCSSDSGVKASCTSASHCARPRPTTSNRWRARRLAAGNQALGGGARPVPRRARLAQPPLQTWGRGRPAASTST